MKNKIPKDLNPSKIKNYICPVCEKKNNVKKNIFFKSVYKDGSFPGYNLSNVVNVIHYIL